jgi:hypothetical protein
MASIGASPSSSQPVPEEISKLQVEPAAEITPENTYVDDETRILMLQAQAAVKLVLDDTAAADNYININQWPSGWTLADTLYQSPAASTAFDGGNVAQANVPKFMVSNHISSIVPKVMGGIFYEKPPFELRPRPGTTQNIVEAKKALFTTQLDMMHFEEEVELFTEHMSLFGTGIMKWGYSEYREKRKIHSRKNKTGKFVGATQEVEPIHTAESDEFVTDLVEVLFEQFWSILLLVLVIYERLSGLSTEIMPHSRIWIVYEMFPVTIFRMKILYEDCSSLDLRRVQITSR